MIITSGVLVFNIRHHWRKSPSDKISCIKRDQLKLDIKRTFNWVSNKGYTCMLDTKAVRTSQK